MNTRRCIDRRPRSFETLEARYLLCTTPAEISPAQRTTLLDGLDALADWADTLEAYRDVAARLPVVGQSIGDALDVSDMLQTRFVDPVRTYLTTASPPTTAGLVTVLAGLDGTTGNLSVTVDDMLVTGGACSYGGGSELVFRLPFNAQRSLTNPLSLGPRGDLQGLSFDAGATVGLAASLLFDVTFGMDLAAGLAPEEAFFIRVADLNASAAATASGLANVGINTGFFDARASGSLALAANLDVTVHNPDGDARGNVTLAELTDTTLATLVTLTPTGSSTGSLTLAVSPFGGFTPTLTPTINFSSANPFTAPTLTLGNFAQLQAFLQLDGSSWLGLVSHVGSWLGSLSDSSALGTALRLVGTDTLGNVLNLDDAWLGKLVANLVYPDGDPQEGLPKFDSAQSFATALATALGVSPASIMPVYNGTTHELKYHVDLDHTFTPFTRPVDLDLSLGSLASIETSSTVSLNVNAGVDLTLGIDLDNFVAHVVATAAAPTNGRLSADAQFMVSVALGTPVAVTLLKTATDANNNLDDLVADLNAALATAGLASDVLAARETPGSSRLKLSTKYFGPVVALGVTAAAADPAVTELRFETSKLALDPGISHLFVEDAQITGSAVLTAADIDASARFGYLGVNVVNGSAAANFTAALQLRDPGTQTPGGRIFLSELIDAAASDITQVVVPPTLAGSVTATLPLQATILGVASTGNPNITVSWPNVLVGSPTVQFNNMADLLKFEHLGDGSIFSAFGDVGDFLALMQGFELYDVQIPGLNRSLGELFDYADRFLTLVEQLATDPNGQLHLLEAKIETALGLPSSAVTIDLVESKTVLKLGLNLSDTFATQVPINLDLDTLGLNGLGNIVDVHASGLVSATASVQFVLDFGVDLTNPAAPRPFLYETTGITLGALVSGTNLDFTTALGPIGAFIHNGSLLIDGDGNAATTADRVELAAGLTDNNAGTVQGKLYLDALTTANVELSLAGQVHLTLPLFFPTSTNFQGNISLAITNLANIGGTTTISVPDITFEFANIDLLNNLGVVLDGIDFMLGGIEDVLDGGVFNARLPLIGTSLADAATFIGDIRGGVLGELRNRFAEAQNKTVEVVRQAVFDALGPGGLDILGERDATVGLTPADVGVTLTDFNNDQNPDQIDFDLVLAKQLALLDEEIDIDLGLPGLGLEIDGQVEVGLGFEWRLRFGINRDIGFYFDTTAADELTVGLMARIPDLHATGQLLFLQLDVTDEDADANPNNDGVDVNNDGQKPSEFLAGLTVDFKDPIDNPGTSADNGKLTFSDIASGGFDVGQVVDARLEGHANLNLNLVLSYDGDARFPMISAELVVSWPFGTTSPSDSPGSGGVNAPAGAPTGPLSGESPSVEFTNVRLNIGSWLEDFVAPVLDTVNKFTKPLRPILDFLSSPVPLMEELGFRITVLDALSLVGYDGASDFLDSLVEIFGIINSIPDVEEGLWIPLGEFHIAGPDGITPLDLRQPQELFTAVPNITNAVNTIAALGNASAVTAAFFQTMQSSQMEFPILSNPATVFRLMLGQTVNLFTYDMADFKIDMPFPIFKVPIIWPLYFKLNGRIEAKLDLKFGFDTHGFEVFTETGDWFDIFSGFYVSDTENADGTGQDVREGEIKAGLEATASIDIVVASFDVGGGVYAGLYADLNDPNHDGKVHLDELLDNIPKGLACTFDTGSTITASLFSELRILFHTKRYIIDEYEIATYEFLDEDCFPDRFTHNNGGTKGEFDIDVRFHDDRLDDYRFIFNAAVDYWETVIVDDLPEAYLDVAMQDRVDDLRIDVYTANLENDYWGRTDVTVYRGDALGLPVHARIDIDRSFLAETSLINPIDVQNMFDLFLHEIGHALGIGDDIWGDRGLLVGSGTTDPRFVGVQATQQYNLIFGVNENGVPVENNGAPGTRERHWRDSILDREVMTGFLESIAVGEFHPLSRISVASLADLGYVVNLNAADPYSPSPPAPSPDSAPGSPTPPTEMGDLVSGLRRYVPVLDVSPIDATDIGIGPGLHLEGLSLETVDDEDWYRFELVAPGSIDVDIRHSAARANVDLEVLDNELNPLGTGRTERDREVVTLANLSPGPYFIRVHTSGTTLNNYKLSVEPAKSSPTRVIYVSPLDPTPEDPDEIADDSDDFDDDQQRKLVSYRAWDFGSAENDGLSPRKPLASLQQVLDTYDLGPGDIVVFDAGTYPTPATLTSADAGATFLGAPTGSLLGDLTITGGTGSRFVGVSFAGATNVTLDNADGNLFQDVEFTGGVANVVINSSNNNLFENSRFRGNGDGMHFGVGGADDCQDNIVRYSEFSSAGASVRLDCLPANTVTNNRFTGSGVLGIRIPAGNIATVTNNDIAGRQTGIDTDSRVVTMTGNRIHHNTVGIVSRLGIIGPDNPAPYGAPGGQPVNHVYSNQTGVQIPADAAGVILRFTDIYSNATGILAHGDRTQIVANNVHGNQVGIRGDVIVGPVSWGSQYANQVHHNDVGIWAERGAEVRFNHVHRNVTGVKVTANSLLHHNLVYRNSGHGILVDGADNVDILNNTIYSTSGNGVHLDNFIHDIRIRSNILQSDGGYGLYVSAASQLDPRNGAAAYASDYNNLYARNGGGVAFQGKGFLDLFDWQSEAESDLHSLGATTIDPLRDDPQFVNLAADDYHTLVTSPTIDAGDPAAGFTLEPGPSGNRVNQGAYGDTPETPVSAAAWLHITYPEFYVDLPSALSHPITWETYNVAAGVNLRIELVEEGSGTVRTISASTPASAGTFTWTPSAIGAPANNSTLRQRVRLTTLSGPALVDRSREPFAVVSFVSALPNTFFVDDASNANDEFTPLAVGNNRNTGLTSLQPKGVIRTLVLSYPMSTSDTVRIDTGNYVHAVNLNLRRTPLAFDPRLQTVSSTTINGPLNLARKVVIDRANPHRHSVAIDLRDAPIMRLLRAEILGADIGVRVREGSTDFIGTNLTLHHHTRDGLAIDTASHGADLSLLEAYANGRHGVFVDSRLDFIRQSKSYDNGQTGFALRSVGGAVIESSEAYCTLLPDTLCQMRGIDIINPGAGRAIVGHEVLTSNLGNKVHHNAEEGIFASGNVLVAGNMVHENNQYGIRMDGGADALRNVVRQHAYGISARGSTSDIEENRSFINSVTGIEASFDSHIHRNITYSNELHGIHGIEFSGVIDHNLVYSTGSNPVHIQGPGTAAEFINNTVYERCDVNDLLPVAATTMDVSWDWQILLQRPDTVQPPPEQTLVPYNSLWEYSDDGLNLPPSWRQGSLPLLGNKSGPAELGYGDGGEATVVDCGPGLPGVCSPANGLANNYITTYFRHNFFYNGDPSSLHSLTLRLRRDDGAIAWLNGVEIARNNLPTGPIDFLTRALFFASDDGNDVQVFEDIHRELLLPGPNTLAIEIHQDNPNSSDISFNAELVAVLPPPGPPPVIPRHSFWQYFDQGIDPGTNWRLPEFPQPWPVGQAELGYGDGGETTVVDCGPLPGLDCTDVNNPPNKFITTYFRHEFSIASASEIAALTLKLRRDDGAIVYLNGVELLRNNLPAGPITSTTLASTATDEGNVFNVFANLPATALRDGLNVIAVEIHQESATSSDISFDLELFAAANLPPVATPLWGATRFEFGTPAGLVNGGTFTLGPGGTAGALTAQPVPSGQPYLIPFTIHNLDLTSMMGPPLPGIGMVHVRQRDGIPATGQLVVENQFGALVGTVTMALPLEFTFSEQPGTYVTLPPYVVTRTITPTDGLNPFQSLQLPGLVPADFARPLETITDITPPTDPPWRWQLLQAHDKPVTIPPPQDRGDFCAEIGVLVSTNSQQTYLRNNIVYIEGDATIPVPPQDISLDIEVRPDSSATWRDSEFNVWMTDHGAVGKFNNVPAVTIPDWQALTLDDDYAINPPLADVWVDPDGNDGLLAGLNGFDDNFHLVSPFGYVSQGALAPIEVAGGLPRFQTVTFATTPGGTAADVSPAVDHGDPDYFYTAEPDIPPRENGRSINAGAYGNTDQASSTEPEYVNLVDPLGKERWEYGRTYDIRWQSHDLDFPGANVDIELRLGSATGSLVATVAMSTPNDGSFFWPVTAAVPAGAGYVIVVRRASTLVPGTEVIGGSRLPFEIGSATSNGPTILRVTPAAIEYAAATQQFSQITLLVSEELALPAATSTANYELRGDGGDGILGNANDILYTPVITYLTNGQLADTSVVTLDFGGTSFPQGQYRFTARSPGLTSDTGIPLDGDRDGVTGGSYVRTFTVDRTPPTVTITPIVPDPRNTRPTEIQFTFSEPVEGVGLSLARLSLNGGRNLLDAGNSLFTTTDNVTWTVSDISRLMEEEGIYTFALDGVDSDVRDLAGNPLTPSVVVDTWLIDATPPVANIVDITPDPRVGSVISATVTTSERATICWQFFSLELKRDGVVIPLTAANTPTTVDNLTWTIPNLAALTSAAGTYTLTLPRDAMCDVAGNRLAYDVRDTWLTFTNAPTAVIAPVAPDPRNSAASQIALQFSRPVTGVNVADFRLLRNGGANLLPGSVTLSTNDNLNYVLGNLAGLTAAAGTYELRLVAAGSGIVDQAGNPLATDAADAWSVDTTPPMLVDIVDVTPDPRNTAVSQITISFSERLASDAGMDMADMFLVRVVGGTASPNLLTAAQTLETVDGQTWTLGNLASLTAAEGEYQLTLVAGGSGIVDIAGNLLPAGGSEIWTVDATPPTVTITPATPDPRTTPVSSMTVVFSEAVSGVDRGDFTLRRNGGPNLLTAAVTVTTANNITFTLNNLAAITTAPGEYELSLHAFGANIRDAAGNLLTAGSFDTWCRLIPGDFNCDGKVGAVDLAILQAHLGMLAGATARNGDMNGDGAVGRIDAALFALVYGQSGAEEPPASPDPLTARPRRPATPQKTTATDEALAQLPPPPLRARRRSVWPGQK